LRRICLFAVRHAAFGRQRKFAAFLSRFVSDFSCYGGLLMVAASMRDCLGRLVPLTGSLVVSAMIFSAPACAARIKHPRAVFAGLDKITGRTIAFEAAADETVQFGTLQVTERACFTRPATEAPQTETFVEVDEVGAGKEFKRIFSGWMFAASPGLHGIEHPIYDIWLTGCEGEGTLEAGLEIPESAMPAETKQARPESSPAPPAKSLRRSHHTQPGENSPARGDETGEMPQEQQPEAELPTLGEPVEVGPAPGFIPVPQESRRKPIQRYYPADPDATPDASEGDGFEGQARDTH
jgi:hypothetical protein